jgi:hypothetical protein
MQPLNPSLYDALKRVFGHVRIANEGQAMVADYVPVPDGPPRLLIVQSGEYYIIRCPYCHDTSGKLWINHRWGVFDRQTGRRNLWLAICYLGDCLSEWDHRVDLADRLEAQGLASSFAAVEVRPGREAPPPGPVPLPEDFRLLADLPRGHPARLYVNRRGFSPAELSAVWGVGFSSAAYPWDRPGRIVIPLRARLADFADPAGPAEDGGPWEVVGYQGRFLGEPRGAQAKYLTSRGTPKSRLLYGLDRVPAEGRGPVVVCEGVSDVWRAGPGAVALLGKEASDAQCKLLRAALPGRDVVVLLDPEAAAEAVKAAEKIRAVLARDLLGAGRPGRVVVARLPDARDPGDCTPEEIAQAVRAPLARGKKQGGS